MTMSYNDLERLVEVYQEDSDYDEDPRDLLHLTFKTANLLESIGMGVSDAVTIIDAYKDVSDFDEEVEDLADATCRTLQRLHDTQRSVSDAVAILDAYAEISDFDEEVEDLADATCRTLQYLSDRRLNVDVIVRRISGLYNEELIKLENRHRLKEQEINMTYSGLIRQLKLMKEKFKYKINRGYSFDAKDACDKVLNQ